MKPLPHLYEVSLSGGPTGHATLLAAGVPPLRSAPPKDFDGPGDAWSPEQFLLAAVETCFMFTFRAVAQASKFDYLSLDLSGSGTVDRRSRTVHSRHDRGGKAVPRHRPATPRRREGRGSGQEDLNSRSH